tara:strand:- start:4590 stop:5210 length:621 start_codon:yes stop_codon:yes gene_type:complete
MKKRFPNQLPVEVRSENGQPVITGYAAVFYRADDPGTEFELMDDYVERIMPGAFTNAIEARQDVRGLFNHDMNQVLGRTTAGTMVLSEDGLGLRYDITMPDTQLGRDVATSISRGDVTGSSFSFQVGTDGAEIRRDDGQTVRELRNLDVFDVGPVTFPAYKGTSTTLRSLDNVQESNAALDQWLEAAQRDQDAVTVRARLIQLDLH